MYCDILLHDESLSHVMYYDVMLSISGSALGLLLVFRTNTAYNRFWEGRRIWEKILNSLRDLGRMTVLYGDVIQPARVERILHLLCAFPLGVHAVL
jgi:predicted membrane chloride channel (bestrophin family)